MGKRWANKKVRQFKDQLPKGSSYKKLFQTWNICDYYNSMTWAEWQELCKNGNWWHKPSEPIFYEWYKAYKRK